MTSIFNKDIIKKNSVSLLLSVVLIAFFVVENINGRFWLNDFKVYYTAASRLLNGGTIYNEAFGLGSGFYKYSPFAAVFFIPFTMFSFNVAAIIYFFIVTALIIYVLNVSVELISMYSDENIHDKSHSQIIILFAFLIGVVHLQRELHLGNVNILLLAILLFSIKGIIENRIIIPSLFIGITILFKPHFLILFPVLLLAKKFKHLLLSSTTIFIGLFIPALIMGLSKDIDLHSQWIVAMKSHNAGIIDAEQTIYFFLNHYFLRYFINDSKVVFIIASILLLTPLLLLFLKERKNNFAYQPKHFLLNSFLLLAIIPSVTLTDTEHFLLSLPLIMYLIYFIRTHKVNPIFLSLFLVGILFYGGNIHDLLGHQLSVWVMTHGLLGIGNLLLISLFLFIRFKED